MAASLNLPPWLQQVKHLVEGSAPGTPGAELLSDRFSCFLDDQPDHLVPLRSAAGEPPTNRLDRMVINPTCIFTWRSDLPIVCAGDPSWLQAFSRPSAMVWVRDPRSKVLQPFCVGARLAAMLNDARSGEPLKTKLSVPDARLLIMAGVLSDPDTSATEVRWAQAMGGAARTFRAMGYVPLPRLLHPFQVSAFRRYYRRMIRTGGMSLGDTQSSRRFFVHNEPVARYFHHQLNHVVSQVAGEPLKPSYVYVASYQEGATLKKHTDREQCEYSISLCVDYAPEPREATPWPLRLHTASGTADVFQGLGDGLFYRGRQIAHSRDPLPRGHSSTSIFFHFVPQDFSGPLV
jgi:hypothetical protein